jgi:ABC-type lipopolysaccharide export system ATPase subunit
MSRAVSVGKQISEGSYRRWQFAIDLANSPTRLLMGNELHEIAPCAEAELT